MICLLFGFFTLLMTTTKNNAKDGDIHGDKETNEESIIVLDASPSYSYTDLIMEISSGKPVDFLSIYKSHFYSICKSVAAPESVFEDMKSFMDSAYELSCIYLGVLFQHRRYQDIHKFASQIDFSGYKRECDYYTAKMIRYYYWAAKELNKVDIDEIYSLKAMNNSLGNRHSVLVLENAVLDFMIQHNPAILSEITNSTVVLEDADKSEATLYHFYLGYINLILGNYSTALTHLDEADILNQKRSMRLNITKCTIVTRLLMGEMDITYSYTEDLKPYYSLIGMVKRGEVKELENLLKTHHQEFNDSMKLYFVIRRLVSNTLREGIIKIASVYRKISMVDINALFGRDVTCLVHKIIQEGYIQCIVEDNILVRDESKRNILEHTNRDIRRIIDVRESIKRLVEYPETPLLTYERLVLDEEELLSKFEI